MSKNPTRDQFAAYAAMYDYFNRKLFGNALAPVLLNFSRKANSYGFFAPERWSQGKSKTHEISLNPSYLSTRDARSTASTLVHEMAHCWQQEHGEDKPLRGYHNKEWAAKMESIGLMPSSTAQPGGKRTGYRVSHYIVSGGPFDAAFRDLPAKALPWTGQFDLVAAKERPQSKVKFTCPSCEANCWGKPTLLVDCGECGDSMVKEGSDKVSAKEAA